MKRWTNGLPGATKRLGAMMALRGLSLSQPRMRADTHDGPEQIAPLQRPDTLMQLSRSLSWKSILYRTAGPYILAHLVSLICIPPFEWSARRFGEILCLRGGIWNSILKRVLPFSRRLCKSDREIFPPGGLFAFIKIRGRFVSLGAVWIGVITCGTKRPSIGNLPKRPKTHP